MAKMASIHAEGVTDLLSYQIGIEAERERIVKRICERISDLKACHKNDNCQEFASLIESYIEEWTEDV